MNSTFKKPAQDSETFWIQLKKRYPTRNSYRLIGRYNMFIRKSRPMKTNVERERRLVFKSSLPVICFSLIQEMKRVLSSSLYRNFFDDTPTFFLLPSSFSIFDPSCCVCFHYYWQRRFFKRVFLLLAYCF